MVEGAPLARCPIWVEGGTTDAPTARPLLMCASAPPSGLKARGTDGTGPDLRHYRGGDRVVSMAIVLLVEDEELVRVLAEFYLEQQGHKVLFAGSPQGAIALLEKTPQIDVLFTDLDLKGDIRAGIKLAQEAIKRWPHLKVLYTTGRDLTDGMQAQFVSKSAFLAKPYTVEELSTALSALRD